MVIRTLTIFFFVAAISVLSGCAVNRLFIPEVHKVQPGESLTSIAAKYDLNWHKLARWNNIKPPYTIHVGQRLSLDAFPPLNYARMGETTTQNRQEKEAMTRHPTPRSTVTALSAGQGPSVKRLSTGQKPQWRRAGNRGATNMKPANRPRPDASRMPPVAVSKPTRGTADMAGVEMQQTRHTGQVEQGGQPGHATHVASGQKPNPPPLVSPKGWRWPLATSVLNSNDIQHVRHGINLYGTKGTPVYAARAGQVVYSGVGLQGYGHLVIINHDGNYLSAYGYVQNVQVQEGDQIMSGEHIADMGIGPGSRAVLHFEIRHDGEPIDPETLLPDR